MSKHHAYTTNTTSIKELPRLKHSKESQTERTIIQCYLLELEVEYQRNLISKLQWNLIPQVQAIEEAPTGQQLLQTLPQHSISLSLNKTSPNLWKTTRLISSWMLGSWSYLEFLDCRGGSRFLPRIEDALTQGVHGCLYRSVGCTGALGSNRPWSTAKMQTLRWWRNRRRSEGWCLGPTGRST
jgi:hypothetical protein